MPAKRKKSRKKIPMDESIEESPNRKSSKPNLANQKRLPRKSESLGGSKDSKGDWLANISKHILDVEDQIAESKRLKEAVMRKRSLDLVRMYRRSVAIDPTPIKEEAEESKPQPNKKQLVILFCGS